MYLIKKGLLISHIIIHNTPNKGKSRKSSTCFGSYYMSIQNKKIILIQNEKDILVHVLGNLGFTNSKVLSYLTSTSVLIVELYYLNSFYQGKKLPFRWHLYLGYQLYCTKSQSNPCMCVCVCVCVCVCIVCIHLIPS